MRPQMDTQRLYVFCLLAAATSTPERVVADLPATRAGAFYFVDARYVGCIPRAMEKAQDLLPGDFIGDRRCGQALRLRLASEQDLLEDSAMPMHLRGGMPDLLPWERPYKSNMERWAEAGVSLQPEFGPDANTDVPLEQASRMKGRFLVCTCVRAWCMCVLPAGALTSSCPPEARRCCRVRRRRRDYAAPAGGRQCKGHRLGGIYSAAPGCV